MFSNLLGLELSCQFSWDNLLMKVPAKPSNVISKPIWSENYCNFYLINFFHYQDTQNVLSTDSKLPKAWKQEFQVFIVWIITNSNFATYLMNAKVTYMFTIPFWGESWQTCPCGGLQWFPRSRVVMKVYPAMLKATET